MERKTSMPNQVKKKPITSAETKRLIKEFIGCKKALLSILGENSDLVKGISEKNIFFVQVEIEISHHGKQRKNHKELMGLIVRGTKLESELLGVRSELVDVLMHIGVSKLSGIHSVIESVQLGKEEVPLEVEALEDKNSRPLKKLDISTRFNNRLPTIQKLLAEEGMVLETYGDLLKFREKKGGHTGVRRRFKKNMESVGAMTVMQMQEFIKKEENK